MDEQVVVFQLAGESYGVDIARVQEIRVLAGITAMPRAPVFVKGVINLRGKVTPVVDMRARFDKEEAEATKETRVIVVSVDPEWIGLIVDSVSEVVRVPEDAVAPPPGLVATVESDFVRGIANLGEERLIILLDLDKLLASAADATSELAA